MTENEPGPVTPRCPGCDSEPLLTWVLPYFCPDETCKVLSWDPDEPGYLFKARATTVSLGVFDEAP